jgi:DNA-directed RNA polymerase subunit beta
VKLLSYKLVTYGKKRERRDYSQVKSNVPLPDLIKVQTKSFQWFIEKGLAELFRDISPIQNFTEDIELYFEDYEFSPEKYDINESKNQDMTYSQPLRVNVKLVNKETGEIKQQKIFMGDFPMMTPNGSFIINGSERVIVSQIVRSAGVFFSENIDKKTLRSKYVGQVIPTRGAWLEYEMGSKNVLFVKLDRSKKIPLTTLLRAIGFTSSDQIIEVYGEKELLNLTLAKDVTTDSGEAIKEVYSKLRQGETATIDGAKSFLMSRLFDAKRYDLAEVGRYKINKKLDVLNRIHGKRLAYDLVDPETGEVIVEQNTLVTRKVMETLKDYRHLFTQTVKGVGAHDLEYDFLDQMAVFRSAHVGDINLFEFLSDEELMAHIQTQEYLTADEYYSLYLEATGKTEKMLTEEFGKPFVKELKAGFEATLDNENIYFELAEIQVLEVFAKDEDDNDIIVKVIGNNSFEDVVHIVPSDIIASISYYLNLFDRVGSLDDIDHLGNRRLRLIGELLKNQFRIGLTKMEKNVKDRMSTKEPDEITPQKLINIRPLTSSLKEFFGSSQLSQFMAQTNPLDELTHKRRISALGPGGLTRDRAGFEVRDVHNSHYGRICPIETPEGQNIGLINSLASYVKVNKYGFMETPYLKVDVSEDGIAHVTNEMVYLAADEEERFVIAQGNTIVGDDMNVIPDHVVARHQGETKMFAKEKLELMDVSPKQIVSISTACIPFLEHDDANRALMGANMQRQAIPLLRPEAPFVGTGIEYKAAHDSGSALVAHHAGKVEYVDANVIRIRREDGTLDQYDMYKFQRSNQGTCINQKPIVELGDWVEESDTITDGPSMDEGELALGRNVTVAFMTWNGYNYEDAIIMSERLVKEDIYTSIHIEKYEIEARDTKLGKEEITR